MLFKIGIVDELHLLRNYNCRKPAITEPASRQWSSRGYRPSLSS